MKRRITTYILLIFGILLLLWLVCLPEDLFDGTTYSTVVEATDGDILGARVASDGQWRFPECDTLPEKFVTALIEFEDRDFYDHCGVSIPALCRAMWQNIRNGRIVSGGSTITMQVIRLSRHGERNLWQKIVECFMATRLELRYSKNEILRLYASHAPFGGNVVGIEAAMLRYFGSTNCDISWAEASTLAVLQNAPSQITLFRNRDLLLAKRNRLLQRLYEHEKISHDELLEALDEPLIDKPYSMPQEAVHLIDWYDKYQHGERIRTHIDLSLQRQVNDLTTRRSQQLRLQGANDLAAVIIDVHSGDIIAYCGNADINYSREGMWVDLARARRSSGSILKPLLYLFSLQEGKILPQMLLQDTPTDFGGFSPKNFDGSYSGAVRADEALAMSLNIPFVEMLKNYGVARFVDALRSSGITTINRPADDYGLSLILGSGEMNLIEITSVYARMAAMLCYGAPYNYDDTSVPLYDRVGLYHTLEAMRKVNRPDMVDLHRISSAQNVAWKTGTSYGSRDAWAIGVTPRYAVGVWVGNADGSSVANLTGGKTAGPIMFDLFDLLPHDTEWFSPLDATEGRAVKVCRHSGYIAGRYCSDSDTDTIIMPYDAECAPVCPYCQIVQLSDDGTHRIVDRSEPEHSEQRFVLPPIMEYYYRQQHPDYKPLPPTKHSANISDEDVVRFIYPADGNIIKLPRQLNGTPGQLICAIACSDSSGQLFWHCNGNYVGSTIDIHQLSLQLTPGKHCISVVDTSGHSASVNISVEE